MYVEDFLPWPIYDKVDKETSSLIDPTALDRRTTVLLSPSNDLCKVFKDKSVQNLLLEKFKNSGMCGEVPQPTILGTYIVYDVQPPGFVYKIHIDSMTKILSIIFYLASKDDDESLGTRLYPGDKKAKHLNVYTDCVKIAPYKPNTILCFSRNDPKFNPSKYWTNHAMINSSTKQRRSIQIFYTNDPLKATQWKNQGPGQSMA